MQVHAVIVLFIVSLCQVAIGSNPLNVYNLPDRIVLYKDIIQDPVILDAIVSYAERDNRIVGGEEVIPHSVPHQVALFIDEQYFCGGSLISADWVLTAAHCVDDARNVVVILGAHAIKQNEITQQTINSTKFIIHPKWDSKLVQNDVGLIKLPNPVTLNENVSPVCLVRSNIAITVGTKVNVTGWGRISDTSSGISPVLRTASVSTISNQECASTYGSSIITNGIICTSTTGGKGTCNGDSGGPLIIFGISVNGTSNQRQCQAGITSFGSIDGCQKGIPTGFSRVAYYLDSFITKETGILACDECPEITNSSSKVNPCSFCVLIFVSFFMSLIHFF